MLLTMTFLMFQASYGQQDTLLNNKGFYVGFTPQYLSVKALKIDQEWFGIRPGKGIRLSEYLYHGYTYMFSDQRVNPQLNVQGSAELMTGGGVEFSWLRYMTRANFRKGFLTAESGLGYHFVRFEYSDLASYEYEESGIRYYSYRLEDGHEDIHRIDLFFLLNYTIPVLMDVALLRVYLGPMYRTSFINNTMGPARDHRSILNPGFKGVGIKSGLALVLKLQ